VRARTIGAPAPSDGDRLDDEGYEMSGPGAVWQQAAETFDRHWQAIGDQWDAKTPCSEWNVRDLVAHAVATQVSMAGFLGADLPADADWPAARAAMEAIIADPSKLDGVAEGGPFNGMPKHQVLGVACGDLLVHSWDLATAIGADDTLPTEAVQATLMGLQRLPAGMLRSPGMFGAALPAAGDADPQAQLLAFTGRTA
jgi:uncharacterized protein (TIGR03086 family)